MPFGAHMSIAGGVDRALLRGQKIGCETIQIFTKSNRQWTATPLSVDEIERWYQNLESAAIAPVVAHTAYLINLASSDRVVAQRSLEALVIEMQRCETLSIPYLVLHPGSHTGAGEEAGLRRIAEALDGAYERLPEARVSVLLETTAGQGTSLGHRFEHLARIIQLAAVGEFLGVCFDTCHALAAGYDIRTPQGYAATFVQFERSIGLERLRVFHINDSRGELGSRVDRHAHIGRGHVGLEGLGLLVNDPRFREHPMLLETPKSADMHEDVENLATLYSLLANSQP
ncbi:MAG: deoxyribonuclease IV [Chloroflexota bacterium]